MAFVGPTSYKPLTCSHIFVASPRSLSSRVPVPTRWSVNHFDKLSRKKCNSMPPTHICICICLERNNNAFCYIPSMHINICLLHILKIVLWWERDFFFLHLHLLLFQYTAGFTVLACLSAVCFLNCRYHLKHIILSNRSALDYCIQIGGTNALIYALIVKTAVTGTHCRILGKMNESVFTTQE